MMELSADIYIDERENLCTNMSEEHLGEHDSDDLSQPDELSQAMKDDMLSDGNCYKCRVCNEDFIQQFLLDEHMFAHHPGIELFGCEICGKEYHSRKGYTEHMAVHLDKRYKCPVCDKEFHVQGRLTRHMLVHLDDKAYKCELCGKSFTQKWDLAIHAVWHTGVKNHKCEICEKTYFRKSSLKSHMKTHMPERVFKCELCQKTFLWKRSLINHMALHTGIKGHRCGVCGKEYALKSQLKFHMYIHTGEKRNFKCDICEKSFRTRFSLNEHVLMHSDKKDFLCEICKKRFVSALRLTRHTDLHSCVKNFQCAVCGKKFLSKSHLKFHASIHSDEKQHSCTDCGKKFLRKNTLMRHLLVHSNEKACVHCGKRHPSDRCGSLSKALPEVEREQVAQKKNIETISFGIEGCYSDTRPLQSEVKAQPEYFELEKIAAESDLSKWETCPVEGEKGSMESDKTDGRGPPQNICIIKEKSCGKRLPSDHCSLLKSLLLGFNRKIEVKKEQAAQKKDMETMCFVNEGSSADTRPVITEMKSEPKDFNLEGNAAESDLSEWETGSVESEKTDEHVPSKDFCIMKEEIVKEEESFYSAEEGDVNYPVPPWCPIKQEGDVGF